jgi:hypothetical protein
VTDLIGEISAAATEQSSGIGQVNTAITEMDKTTQQNAALVEESAAAATTLSDQAARLAQAVSVFTLDKDHAMKASSRPSEVTRTPAARKAPAMAAAGGERDWQQF